MPTRVLLLRHAQTASPDRFHGAESDVGLGDRGHAQALAVASELAARRPDVIASSAMRRALETARPIAAACGLPIEVVEPLHERRMGALSGADRREFWPLYEAEKARWMAGDLDATHDGAESFAEVRDRVVPALDALADRHPGRTVVVVTHGVVIRVLLTSLLPGFGPADFDGIAIDFVGAHEIRRDGRTWHAESVRRGTWGLDSPGLSR